MKLYELESTADRQREDAVRPGPPYEIAAKKIAALVGVTLQDKALERASLAAHYGTGAVVVAAVPAPATHHEPAALGRRAGHGRRDVGDRRRMDDPRARVQRAQPRRPPGHRMRGVAAHLVFGLGVAATTEALWAARGRRP